MDQIYVVEHHQQHRRNASSASSSSSASSFARSVEVETGSKAAAAAAAAVASGVHDSASDWHARAMSNGWQDDGDEHEDDHPSHDEGDNDLHEDLVYDEDSSRWSTGSSTTGARLGSSQPRRRRPRDSGETLVDSSRGSVQSDDGGEEEMDVIASKHNVKEVGALSNGQVEQNGPSVTALAPALALSPLISSNTLDTDYTEREEAAPQPNDLAGEGSRFSPDATLEVKRTNRTAVRDEEGGGTVGNATRKGEEAAAVEKNATPRRPLTLIERHASLLSQIAQKEAQVRRTRLILATQEAELEALKGRWENVAARSAFLSTTSGGSRGRGSSSRSADGDGDKKVVQGEAAAVNPGTAKRDRARRRAPAATMTSSSLVANRPPALDIPGRDASSSCEATPTGSPYSSAPSTPLATSPHEESPRLSGGSRSSDSDAGAIASHHRTPSSSAPARSMPSIFGQFIGQLQSVVEDAVPALALVASAASTSPTPSSSHDAGPAAHPAKSHQTPKGRARAPSESGSSVKAAARASLEAARDAKRLSASGSSIHASSGLTTPIAPPRSRARASEIDQPSHDFASPMRNATPTGATPRTPISADTPRRGHRPLSLLVNRQQQNHLLAALDEAEQPHSDDARPKSAAGWSRADENVTNVLASPRAVEDRSQSSASSRSRLAARTDLYNGGGIDAAQQHAQDVISSSSVPTLGGLSWRHRLEDVLNHPSVKAQTNRASSYLSAGFVGETLQMFAGVGGAATTGAAGSDSFKHAEQIGPAGSTPTASRTAFSVSAKEANEKPSLRAEAGPSRTAFAALAADRSLPRTEPSPQQEQPKRSPPMPVNAGRLRPNIAASAVQEA